MVYGKLVNPSSQSESASNGLSFPIKSYIFLPFSICEPCEDLPNSIA